MGCPCICIIHDYQNQIITCCRTHNTHPKLHILLSGNSPTNFASLSLMCWATTWTCLNLWKVESIFSCIFCYKNTCSRAVIFMPSFKAEWLYTVKLQPSKMWIYNTYNGSPVTVTFQMWHSYKCQFSRDVIWWFELPLDPRQDDAFLGQEDFHYLPIIVQNEDGIFLLRRQLCSLIRDPVRVINDWASVGLKQLSVSSCLILSAELKTYCCCKHHIYILNHPKSWQQLKNLSISQTNNCGHLFCLVVSELLGTQVMFPPVFQLQRLKYIKSTHMQ